jgi:molecular chaperone DnaK
VQAAIIAGEPLDAILVDVTPHSLGIEVAEIQFGRLIPDRYSVIIQRNTTIPTSRSEVYSALHPTQTEIRLKIYQGEDPVASRNRLLGEFLFDQLRPEVPGEPPRITVQFDFDINGMLHVSAVDRGSGKQARTSVTATHTELSPAEIASKRDELEALSVAAWNGDVLDMDEYDDEEDENLEIVGLLARARRALTHSTGVEAADLQSAITALEQAVSRGDDVLIEERADALLDLLYEMEEDEEDGDDSGDGGAEDTIGR